MVRPLLPVLLVASIVVSSAAPRSEPVTRFREVTGYSLSLAKIQSGSLDDDIRGDFVELVEFARLYRKPLDYFAEPRRR